MRRALSALGLAAIVGLGAAPARAGALEWKDAEGDATPVPVAQLSETTLDILKSSVVADSAALTWRVQLKKIGDMVPGGTGYYYGMVFNYGEGEFTFRLTEDQVAGRQFQFQRKSGSNQVSAVTCVKCTMIVDKKQNTVTLKAPIASIAGGVRQDSKEPLKSGSEITNLRVTAGRAYAAPELGPFLWTAPNDTAATDKEFVF